MGVLNNILRLSGLRVIPTPTDGDYTITPTDSRIEVDASENNVTVTLPTVTTAFQNRPSIEIVRIDASPTNIKSLSIFSITRSGSTVTVTTVDDHNMIVGQAPDIRDVVEDDYNINNAIILTVPTSKSFTYVIADGLTPTTPGDTTSAFADIVYRVNVVGTSSNFGVNEDLGLDDLYGDVKVYASDIWRIDGANKLERGCLRQNLSTTLTSVNGDLQTLFTNNNDGTFDINHSGSGIIVDRSIPYSPVVYNITWEPQTDIPTPDGTLINIAVNRRGIIEAIALSASKLPIYEKDTGIDANRLIQLGFSQKSGGVLTDSGADMTAIQFSGNLGIAKTNILRNMLGSVRSLRDPIALEYTSGTLTDSTETPTEGTINASCGVPGGSDNNTINCVQFKAHPTNGKGYCGFYSNFPDSLNPKLETIANSLVVELSSTYIEDQGYFEDDE